MGGELVSQYLVPPAWLKLPYTPQDLGRLFGRAGKTPYTACNVIVLRHGPHGDEVLLSRRLMGSGVDTLSLPGGKKNECESVRECVIRELREEVGLIFKEGRPVSCRETNEPGFPRVTSIGVLATETRGSPRNREHLAHSKWEWFKIDNLPSPLFFPTELTLSDFLTNQFPELKWRDVEGDLTLPLWRNVE